MRNQSIALRRDLLLGFKEGGVTVFKLGEQSLRIPHTVIEPVASGGTHHKLSSTGDKNQHLVGSSVASGKLG